MHVCMNVLSDSSLFAFLVVQVQQIEAIRLKSLLFFFSRASGQQDAIPSADVIHEAIPSE